MMMIVMMMMMMIMTLMKLVNSATKFRHGMDKFYQPNSGLGSSRSLHEAIYTYYINATIWKLQHDVFLFSSGIMQTAFTWPWRPWRSLAKLGEALASLQWRYLEVINRHDCDASLPDINGDRWDGRSRTDCSTKCRRTISEIYIDYIDMLEAHPGRQYHTDSRYQSWIT